MEDEVFLSSSRRLFTENGSTRKSAYAETTGSSPLAPPAGQGVPAGCWQDPSRHLAHQSYIRKSDRAQGCVRAASDSERETTLHLSNPNATRDRAPRESSPPPHQTQGPKTVIDEQSPTCANEYSLQSLFRRCWPLPATMYQQELVSPGQQSRRQGCMPA